MPNAKSRPRVGLAPLVITSMYCRQLRAIVSLGGVHDAVPDAHSRPSRNAASVRRPSAVSIGLLELPFCGATGGGSISAIVGVVSAAELPPSTPGTPVTDHTFRLSSHSEKPVTQAEAIQSVEVEVRLLAGMIGKSELSSPGGL